MSIPPQPAVLHDPATQPVEAARPSLAVSIRLALAEFRSHNASQFGAALAFYCVFSVVPTLLIAIAVTGLVVGRDYAESEILRRIGGSFGSAAGVAVAAMIKEAGRRPVGWLATGLSITSLYFGLSGVYRQIDGALHTIWHEQPAPGAAGVRGVTRKAGSMLLVLGAGLVVAVSVAADAAIAITGKYAAARLIGGELIWHGAQLVVSTVVLTALFATVFRYLGQEPVRWRDVRPGAILTAVLFVAGKLALGIYLGKAAVGSAFGAAGSIVVVLLWSYWSAQIFFFGLEFTHVYSRES